MGGYGISLHTMADLGDLRSGVFFFLGKRESGTKAQKDRLIAGYNLGYFTAYKYTV